MNFRDYTAKLQQMRGNSARIREEKQALERRVDDLIGRVFSAVPPTAIIPTLKDTVAYEQRQVAQFFKVGLSNTAGQFRFLRGLLASRVPEGGKLSTSKPETKRCVAYLEQIWDSYFFLDMLDALAPTDSLEVDQRETAGVMALLAATQADVAYSEQAERRAQALFTPFDRDVVIPRTGLSTQECIDGMRSVWKAIVAQNDASFDLMDEAWRAVGLPSSPPPGTTLPDPAQLSVEQRTMFAATMQRAFKARDNYLVISACALPDQWSDSARASFFKLFAFEPGTINQEFRRPSDENEVLRRPLLHLGSGEYLLVDTSYCLFAPYRALYRTFDSEKLRARLVKRRSTWLEERATELFSKVIHPDLSLQRYYIPCGPDGTLAEHDVLMVKGGRLVIIEAKSKPLRNLGRTGGNLQKLKSDFDASVGAGFDQCRRMAAYVGAAQGEVEIFDASGQITHRIPRKSVTQVYQIVLLDESYSHAATDLRPWLPLQPGEEYPWVVDQDTLDTMLLKIKTPEEFFAFIDWRTRNHGVFQNSDEACFAGYFLEHGPVDPPPGVDDIQLGDQYSDIFDAAYFEAQGLEPAFKKATGPPVFSTIQRTGDDVTFTIDGRTVDRLSLKKETSSSKPTSPKYRFKKRKKRR